MSVALQPTLKTRPQRWNQKANTVYVETPAMTGFSYCDNDCAWDDESTADAHYQMTLAFFDKFPEFHERELYFTGNEHDTKQPTSEQISRLTVACVHFRRELRRPLHPHALRPDPQQHC